MFVSYGRSSDVAAWIGDSPYVTITTTPRPSELTSEVVVSEPVDDDGSATVDARADLGRRPSGTEGRDGGGRRPRRVTGRIRPVARRVHSDERTVTTTIDVPDDISVLIASDGTAPAPTDVCDRLAARQLDAVGGTAAGRRRARLPRRHRAARLGLRAPPPLARTPSQPPKGPRGKLPSAPKPPVPCGAARCGSGRRAIGRAKRIALLPLIVIPALALTACSADYWPSFDQAAADDGAGHDGDRPPIREDPDASEAPDDDETEAMEPAVTVPQMERIMARSRSTTTEADAALDPAAIAERFTGPALARSRGQLHDPHDAARPARLRPRSRRRRSR